jgi:hypothetical protein
VADDLPDWMKQPAPQASPEQLPQWMQPTAPAAVTAGGLGKAFASGLRGSVESMAGMPADLVDWEFSKAAQLAKSMGASPETLASIEAYRQKYQGATTPTVQAATDVAAQALPGGETIQDVTRHTPQNIPEQYFSTLGSFAPSVVGGEATIPARIARAVLPALGSETGAQLVPQHEAAARAIGGLGTSLLPAGMARTMTGFRSINPVRAANVDVLRQAGVRPTAGQATGFKPLQYLEAGATGQALAERQAENFSRAALAKAGITGESRATPEVLNKAFDDIGQRFDELAARTTTPLDQQLQNDLLNTTVNYQNLTGAPARAVEGIMDEVNAAATANNGVLSGESYKAIRSKIGRNLRGSSSPEIKTAMHDMQEALDNAVERGMGNSVPAEWRDVRNQYRNLKVVENAMTGSAEATAEGLVTPTKLGTATIQGPGSYARGTSGDYSDLARAGLNLLKPLPQSGTAPRLMFGGGLIGAGGAAGADLWANPQHVLPMAGSAAALLAGRQALRSRPVQDWLLDTAMGRREALNPMVAALLARQAFPAQQLPPVGPQGPLP